MANALETLCGQAYGAQQYHLLGVFLQRAVLVFAATGEPIALLFLNMGRVLVALGQDPAIAQAAQSYTYWALPLVALYAILHPVIKFFQTQHAVVELMVSWAVMAVVHVPLCWLIVDKLGLGLKGVAIATNISTATNLAVSFAFIRFSPRFAKTFPSFTWEAFRDVGDFFRLAVPSATMLWYVVTILEIRIRIPSPEST
jgi:MATE family multidrug resistance protein